MTPQRQAVLDLLKRADSRPDATWVCEQARKVVPDITLPTVERTITLLREAGFLDERGAAGKASRFPIAAKPFPYADPQVPSCRVRCVRCGRVVEMRRDECQDLAAKVGSATGFAIHQHFEFQGLCPDCAEERSKVVAGR
jgi:Fur family ferric uptake transcriptional regulator/Fur family peroxide stress response transcriptional regulator